MAQTPTIPCGARASILGQLAERYHEAPANMMLANSGGIVEILTSETGSWTIVLTHPNGISCLLRAGEHWEPAKQKKKKARYTPS